MQWLVAFTLAGCYQPPRALRAYSVHGLTRRSGAAFAAQTEEEETAAAIDGDLEGADVPDCDVTFDAQSMPGACEPFGFFDPVGFTKDASEGRIRFYREVEVGWLRGAHAFPCSQP